MHRVNRIPGGPAPVSLGYPPVHPETVGLARPALNADGIEDGVR